MKLIQRIGYYLGGFAIGLIILAFFLTGKKTSCSYGPDARVLKNINSKKLIYSQSVQNALNSYVIDSVEIDFVLKKGDINFSESDPRKTPCAIYMVEGSTKNKEIFLTIENCDSTATIINLKTKQ
ncbi:hypothetical protein WJN01_09110 [Flavobacteriaceae bacterium SZ-1-7]|uniref:hypothetical protein n=1 Tax=Tamlana sedimenti TaxID=3134126 RepID=UPI00312A3D5E